MADQFFKCTLCNRLPVKAVETACGHFFCDGCLEEFTSSGQDKKKCPDCGNPTKRWKKVPFYEDKLRAAFPESYALRDARDTIKKTSYVDELGILTRGIMNATHARDNLLSRLRGADINAQAEEYFGTSRKYNVIVADVPWNYGNQHFNGGTKGNYSSMTDEEIYSLPVEGLCRESAALLFWTTYPKMQIALNCMYAWGFRYSTCFLAWSKIYPKNYELCCGGGCYTRPNTEVCLLGLKGDFSKFRMRDTCISNAMVEVPQINPLLMSDEPELAHKNLRLLGHHERDEQEFWENVGLTSPLFTPRGEHSEKPIESYEKIIAIFGDVPRFDMFARKRRSGWDSFGDQLDKFPPDMEIDEKLEREWKARQDRNATFEEQFMPSLTEMWNNREGMEIDFTPV